jgi:hypothetical protein
MSRKIKSNLLKNVLKQAELMRAPFHGVSWPNKITETDKKSLSINKTGEKFRSKLAKLSVGETWSSIKEVCLCRKNIFYTSERFVQSDIARVCLSVSLCRVKCQRSPLPPTH